MKKVTVYIDINSAMSICVMAGVVVYPVIVGKKFGVEVNYKNKIIKGNKVFTSKEIANACSKTYKYYAAKLKEEETNAQQSK